MPSLTKVSFNQAMKYAETVLKSGHVPFVSGSPGLGKSAMAQLIADKNNLKKIDVRLSQEDPSSINGFPDTASGRSQYIPPSRFPLEGDNLPIKPEMEDTYNQLIEEAKNSNKGLTPKVLNAIKQKCCYAGWLIIYDELPSAPRAIIAAAYKLLLDREVGEHKMHKNVWQMAAGNLLTDNAIAGEMGTAARSRVIHIHVASKPSEFQELMFKRKWDPRLIAYLSNKENQVNNFAKFDQSPDETFACERTWEFVNDQLAIIEPDTTKPIPSEFTELLVGTVGSIGREFVTFTKAFKDIATKEQILSDPHNAPLPESNATKFLMCSMLSSIAEMSTTEKVGTINQVMVYTKRMPKEFQFIVSKLLWHKDDSFIDNEDVMEIFNEAGNLALM